MTSIAALRGRKEVSGIAIASLDLLTQVRREDPFVVFIEGVRKFPSCLS